MKLSTALRNAACNAVVDSLDQGSGAATIEIRTGSTPASPQATATGTLLVTLTAPDPAFGNAGASVAGRADMSSSINATISTSGTAGHFRIKDSDGTALIDGTVGTSGADLNFNTVTFVSGGTCTISSFSILCPES